LSYVMAPRLRPLLTPPNDGTQKENKLDLRVALKKGAGQAHCISDWGHDFRPDYRRLVNILQRMPGNVPILGTTATANNRVIEDVHNQLGDIGIQRGSLMRSTLALQTVRLPTQAARLAWMAEHVSALPGTGIVYTLTKRDAKQVAEWLHEVVPVFWTGLQRF